MIRDDWQNSSCSDSRGRGPLWFTVALFLRLAACVEAVHASQRHLQLTSTAARHKTNSSLRWMMSHLVNLVGITSH